MHRRFVHSLLVCIALTVALMVPVRARAAFLPVCENRELTALPPLPIADTLAEPVANAACTAPRGDAEGAWGARSALEDGNVAPMCDLRGASMVAPPRVHLINDDRIEASPSCEVASGSPMLLPGPRDSSAIHSGVALAVHATLVDSPSTPRACSELGPAYLPPEGEALAGIERDVYHPPR